MMTLKEIIDIETKNNYGFVRRESANKYDYFIFNEYLVALDKDGYLKTFTPEELSASDWSIYSRETL